jgi:hypothetical protein
MTTFSQIRKKSQIFNLKKRKHSFVEWIIFQNQTRFKPKNWYLFKKITKLRNLSWFLIKEKIVNI